MISSIATAGNVVHESRYTDSCVASEPTWQTSCHATEDTLFVASELVSDVERHNIGIAYVDTKVNRSRRISALSASEGIVLSGGATL